MRTAFILILITSIIITLTLFIRQLTPYTAWAFSLPNLSSLKQALNHTSQTLSSLIKDLPNTFRYSSLTPTQTPTFKPKPTFTPTPTPYQKTIPLPDGSKIKIKINPQTKLKPNRSCYRYTIPHLDGSTSSLCYTKSDYDQLTQLGYQLTSAKAFYKFHLKGAESYQKEYEKTQSPIYLEAKKRSLEKANQEKQKITQIIARMQEIERRGW